MKVVSPVEFRRICLSNEAQRREPFTLILPDDTEIQAYWGDIRHDAVDVLDTWIRGYIRIDWMQSNGVKIRYEEV